MLSYLLVEDKFTTCYFEDRGSMCTAKIGWNHTVTELALCKWGHFERVKPVKNTASPMNLKSVYSMSGHYLKMYKLM